MANSSGGSLACSNPDIGSARAILRCLFQHFDRGIVIRLWDGSELQMGVNPRFALVFHSAAALRAAALSRDPVRLAQLYLSGDLDIEGDLYSAIQIRHHLTELRLSLLEKVFLTVKALMIHTPAAGADLAQHRGLRRARGFWVPFSAEINHHAASFSHDVADDFYRLWLGERMNYSCAHFDESGQSLGQAQRNKLDEICRKLRLKPGEHLLDIGCGWGALLCWAAERYRVKAHGITLSRSQYDHVQDMIRARELEGQVTVKLLDYRDLQGEARYDKLVSVGMFEHVGAKNLPAYFANVNRLLKPGGLFLNHGITSEQGGREQSPGGEFIHRYVFPEGQLETVSRVQKIMEDSGLEIHDVEALRQHYALTLREWVKRLDERHEEALQHVSEPVYRIWRLYMAASALQLEEGVTGIYQILASRRAPHAVRSR